MSSLAPPAVVSDLRQRADRVIAGGRGQAVLDGLWVAGLIYLAVLTIQTAVNGPAYDARAYYDAQLDNLYARSAVGTFNAFYYSPAFAQVLAPLTALPWPVFITIWMGISAAALAWLSGRLLLFVLLFPPVVVELQVANIHFLLALAAAVGIRYPAAWAFPLLTKITPGIGVLWFAVRREWRGLLTALGSTAAIIAISFAIAPQLWLTWLDVLQANSGTTFMSPLLPVPLAIRLGLASGLIAWGALADHRWTVPLGATMALPLLWPANLAMLVGVLPSVRRGLGRRFGPIGTPG